MTVLKQWNGITEEWEVIVAGENGPPGPQGVQGETGPAGLNGADGVGLPVGGLAGQVLAKRVFANYDVEWVDAAARYDFVNIQAGTTYSLTIDDPGRLVASSNSSAVVFTVTNMLPALGDWIDVVQLGTGELSVVGAVGITVDQPSFTFTQYAGARLTYISGDRWVLVPWGGSGGTGTTYDVFDDVTDGLAPASGGGAVNYLRADGTWSSPPGVAGVSNSATFSYNATTTEPPTGNQLRANNVTLSAATRLWVMQTTVDGLDVAIGLARILPGHQIYFQDRDNAANWVKYDVTASTDDGAYYDFTVTYHSGAGTVPAGQVEFQAIAPGTVGVPAGGSSGQALTKTSGTDYAVGWSTVVTPTSTATLTNKRITKRTSTEASSATPTINTDNVEFHSITAQTVDITSMTTNLSGAPTEGQTLWIAITGTAARAITWGASFEASTVALPTTTVTTARLDVGFIWNTVTSKWRCVATC